MCVVGKKNESFCNNFLCSCKIMKVIITQAHANKCGNIFCVECECFGKVVQCSGVIFFEAEVDACDVAVCFFFVCKSVNIVFVDVQIMNLFFLLYCKSFFKLVMVNRKRSMHNFSNAFAAGTHTFMHSTFVLDMKMVAEENNSVAANKSTEVFTFWCFFLKRSISKISAIICVAYLGE